MLGPFVHWSASAIATSVPIGPGGTSSTGAFAVAVVIVAGMLAYTWVATRMEARRHFEGRSPRSSGSDARRSRRTPSEPEPLVDRLFRDLEDARRDRAMVRAARRRIRASRRPGRPPPPAT